MNSHSKFRIRPYHMKGLTGHGNTRQSDKCSVQRGREIGIGMANPSPKERNHP